jgi:hypothetical protein
MSEWEAKMMHEEEGYVAYLLRLWPVRNGESTQWRASLESPYSGERHGFVDLEAMLAFLEQEVRKRQGERGEA